MYLEQKERSFYLTWENDFNSTWILWIDKLQKSQNLNNQKAIFPSRHIVKFLFRGYLEKNKPS